MPKPRSFFVEWTDAAVADLRSILAYLADENPAAALLALERIEARAACLRALPFRGRVVPELAAHDIHTCRELLERPWRIVYRTEGPIVRVLAVLDARRSLEDLLLARFLRVG